MRIIASISRMEFGDIDALLNIDGAGQVRVLLEKVYAPEGWRVSEKSPLRPEKGSPEEAAIVNAVAEAIRDFAEAVVPRPPDSLEKGR